ncbi:MAG: AraC family transcriptional regulator N-terminal domain-containing protein [Massilia sp.]
MTTLEELRRLATRLLGANTERSVCGLRIRRVDAPNAPVPYLAEAAFGMVLQGSKRVMVAGQALEYGPGDCIVLSLSMPVTGQVSVATREEPYLALAWALDPAGIASLLLEAGQHSSAEAGPAMAVHAAGPALTDALARLLLLADRPADIAIMQPMLHKEILWRLLSSEHGAVLHQFGLADSRLQRISRVIHWLRQHYDQPVRTDALEQISGMSAASLFRHFKAATAMSPLQYQKQIRLHNARMRLAAGARDVAQVAYQVGYESPSQFSREYSRLFGHPPRQDLRQRQPQAQALLDADTAAQLA